MGQHRRETLALIAVGGLLTALSVVHLAGGRYDATVVTGLGAVLSFLLVVLLSSRDRRRPPRP